MPVVQMVSLRLSSTMASHALILLACAIFVCFEASAAATVVDVYRMIQYDIAGSPFGARKSLLNAYASSGQANLTDLELARAAVITPILDLNLTLLNRECCSLTQNWRKKI